MAMIQKRTLKDGTARWKAVIRRKGVPKRSRTFRTRAQAAAWAKRAEVRILDGRAPADLGEERRTVNDVIDEYIQQVLPGFGFRDRQKRLTHLKWWSERSRLPWQCKVHIRLPAVGPKPRQAVAWGPALLSEPTEPSIRTFRQDA